MMLLKKDSIQSIGTWVNNHRGELMGKVEDIKIDSNRNIVEYLIICCNEMFGNTDRYFAVSASPSLIKIEQGGGITIRVDKQVLEITIGVPADKCPKFDPGFSDSIFELYDYERSSLN